MKHCYTKGLCNKRIAVLGPVPPPLGGVSVHVQRVIALLQHQGNIVKHIETCAEYRYRFLLLYLLKVALLLLCFRPDELHLHTLYVSNSLPELRVIMFCKNILAYNIVLIEHDCRHLYQRSARWQARLKQLLSRVSKHVFIGNLTLKSYKDHDLCVAQTWSVESAFIPPDIADEQSITASYPQDLFNVIHMRRPLLLANAFQLSLLDGKDLYGFDQCIYALRRVKEKHQTVGWIFAMSQIGDQAYYDQLMAVIKQHELQDHCYFLIGQRQIWPLMKHVDLFVRPTLSDGASVSIEEALWAGKPVVASNVCLRPAQVITYDVCNENDLWKAIIKSL